jgi:DNA processing protein
MVGARAATAYGEHITMDITQDLCTRGFAVISGGAFGVDAAAHRAVLTQGGYTLAAMAGGVDRLYPAANHQMLRSVMESGGSVISEVPCGALPMKQRFLARNRVIACLASATVVVEAALRSGALSTANHATHLNRPVGAVPGPVTSMQSAGCHELIRSGAAMCVTEGAEVADLAGGMGVDAAPGKAGADATTDGLSQNELSVLDSFPARGSTTVTALARNGGVSVPGVLSALGVLETRGLVSACGSQWRRGK